MSANVSEIPGAAHPSGRVPVAIVGAGPVGLALALGLSRHGVPFLLLERRQGTREQSRAPAIHVRTREVFRQWGVEEGFLAAGRLSRRLDLRDAGTDRPLAAVDFHALDAVADRPGILVLEQGRTESLLLEAVRRVGVGVVRFGTEVTAVEARGAGVALTVRRHAAKGNGTERVEAEYVVGCDGAGSFVRHALGLPFDGETYALRPMLADVRVADGRDRLRWPRVHNGRRGLTVGIRLEPGLWRIIRIDPPSADGEAVPDGEVRRRAAEALGPGPVETVWASRFRIHRRAAPRFRAGRVLLAGDAAHIHSPIGGQGMNAGIQDAHNLAWKLAAALAGGEEDRLLDSYDAERRAVVVGSVSRYTDLMTRAFLMTPRPARRLAFLSLRAALALPPIRRRFLRRAAMLDLHYPPSPVLDPAAPRAGERLPNPVLRTPDGAGIRLYDLLGTDPVVVRITDRGESRLDDDADVPLRVIRIGVGGYEEPVGVLRRLVEGGAGQLLVRPDGHIAWAGGLDGDLETAARHALAGTWWLRRRRSTTS